MTIVRIQYLELTIKSANGLYAVYIEDAKEWIGWLRRLRALSPLSLLSLPLQVLRGPRLPLGLSLALWRRDCGDPSGPSLSPYFATAYNISSSPLSFRPESFLSQYLAYLTVFPVVANLPILFFPVFLPCARVRLAFGPRSFALLFLFPRSVSSVLALVAFATWFLPFLNLNVYPRKKTAL